MITKPAVRFSGESDKRKDEGFRFRLRDAFIFGFFAGWGMACVYIVIRLADAFLARF